MQTGDQSSQASYRRVNVRTTAGSNISGKVNIGACKRVSDLFMESGQQFIVLVDFVHRAGSGKVLLVNKRQIVWIEPLD